MNFKSVLKGVGVGVIILVSVMFATWLIVAVLQMLLRGLGGVYS